MFYLNNLIKFHFKKALDINAKAINSVVVVVAGVSGQFGNTKNVSNSLLIKKHQCLIYSYVDARLWTSMFHTPTTKKLHPSNSGENYPWENLNWLWHVYRCFN